MQFLVDLEILSRSLFFILEKPEQAARVIFSIDLDVFWIRKNQNANV